MSDILNNVSPEKAFWASNGAIVKNLKELEPAIEYMDENTFRSHVNEGKNDFSAWVASVIRDEKLAAQLAQTTDKTRTQLLVVKRVLESYQ
jgi:hypothetical protein